MKHSFIGAGTNQGCVYQGRIRPSVILSVRDQWLKRFVVLLLMVVLCGVSREALAQNADPANMKGMVLVGYQGWFRCPGDGSPGNSWSHWSKGSPTPATMSIDLYPDVSELDPKSVCKLPAATIGDKPGFVFSSFPKETAETHFAWMQAYGIDGVLLQRFINSIPGQRKEGDVVLKNVRAAAEDHGRVFAIEYDLSGAHLDTVLPQLQADWEYMGDSGILDSKAYLRLGTRPVVSLWGLGFGDSHHIGDPQLALRIIQWFQQQQHAIVMGGTPSGWGSLSGDSSKDPEWAKVYAALDIVQPWTVGRYGNLDGADQWKSSHLVPDMKLTGKNRQLYMPVIFPGFSWHNLKPESPANQIPRLGGAFFWKQAYNAKVAGAPMVKIAMFDEVNEATAILKAVSEPGQAPQPGYWLTLGADGDHLPNDWYLQIAQEVSKMFRGQIAPASKLPLKKKTAQTGRDIAAK